MGRFGTIRNVSYRNEGGSPARPAGRPRDDRREAAILETAVGCLAEVGYERLSIEMVAARAGASKATIYRRWASKRDLVVAAVRTAAASSEQAAVDTGSLRGDLLALLDRLAANLDGTDRGSVAALLQAGLQDPELCDALEAGGPTGGRLPADVLDRAIARGELPAGASPFPYDEVAASTTTLRALNGLPYDRAYREQLVDRVLIPALGARPGPAPFAGIFAGVHPR